MSQIQAASPAAPISSETKSRPPSNCTALSGKPPGKESAPNVKARWGAAVLIATALCAGVALVVGHDRFNNYLHGKRADEIQLSQQWVSRIATAFTFLVKTALATAVTTSYAQRLWRNVRSRSTFEVQTVDVLMAAPTSALSFLHPRAWFRVPEMLVMGLVIWGIPFAVIIPPSTLTVVSNHAINNPNLQVPQLSFDSSSWASIGPPSSRQAFWSASASVQRAGFAAATAGQVIGVRHIYANESYQLAFNGPAIQCSMANDTVRDAAQKFFNDYSGSGGHYAYVAWAGDMDHGIISGDTAVNSGAWDSLDLSSADAARIFVYSTMGGSFRQPDDFRNVTECLLYNASYAVTFSIENGISLAAANLTLGNKLAAMGTLGAQNVQDAKQSSKQYSYQAVMDVFGKLLVGYAYAQNDGIKASYSSFQRTYVNFRDTEGTQRGLETLFQNITLSMFSSPDLLLDSAQTSPVPVQVTSYPLTYEYLPRDFWIAYGAAMFATLIAAMGGLQAVWKSGASYSLKFSTAARIAKYTGLDEVLAEDDDGSDPLPDAAGKTRLRIHREMP